MRLATAIVAVALLATGCGEDSDTSEPDSPVPEDGRLVDWSRSGGIAGVVEEMTIERDGSATLTVGVDAESTEFRLADGELAQLADELEAADFEAVEPPPAEAVCADCFVYAITVAGEKRITLDDLAERPESVSTVISHLGAIAMEHYPPDVPQVGSGA